MTHLVIIDPEKQQVVPRDPTAIGRPEVSEAPAWIADENKDELPPFLMEATIHGRARCQWIHGEGDSRSQCFHVADGVDLNGKDSPYCKHHHAQSRMPGTALNPALIKRLAKLMASYDWNVRDWNVRHRRATWS